MTAQGRAELPSQEELEQLQHLTTYTGASLKHLMDFRNIVLHAAAVKLRDWNGPDFIEERWAVGVEDAANFIDPGHGQ